MNPMNPQPVPLPQGRRAGRYQTKRDKAYANDQRGKKREANLKELGLWHLRHLPKIGKLPNTATRAIINAKPATRRSMVKSLIQAATTAV